MHGSKAMSNVKTMLRVGGVALAALGLMFLPSRNYVFDKGDLSAFHDVTELAVFTWVAFGLILVGLVAFALSFIVRGALSD
jgi:hypothetical protein